MPTCTKLCKDCSAAASTSHCLSPTTAETAIRSRYGDCYNSRGYNCEFFYACVNLMRFMCAAILPRYPSLLWPSWLVSPPCKRSMDPGTSCQSATHRCPG